MTHIYKVTGMTCPNCEAKVKSGLLTLPDIISVDVSKDKGITTITMDKHIPISDLQKAIGGEKSQYQISAEQHNEVIEQTRSWFTTYKPLLLVFLFISGISILSARTGGHIQWAQFMNNFMAGFFIVFSFFKLLDLKGFAESYSMYDIVAMKVKPYGYIYPFIELALGISYLTAFNPTITNIATCIVMGVSSIGVIKSVLNKQKIRCACLGAVFNLPMSTITITEDLLMIAMAVAALTLHN